MEEKLELLESQGLKDENLNFVKTKIKDEKLKEGAKQGKTGEGKKQNFRKVKEKETEGDSWSIIEWKGKGKKN